MFETIPGLSFKTVPCHLKQNARKKQKDKEEWNTVCTLVLIRAVTSATSAIRCQHELSFFVAVRQWTPTCKEGWLTINVNHGHLSTSTASSIFHYFCHWFSDVIFLSSATYAIKCFYLLYGECNYIIPEMTRDGISSLQKLDIVSLYNWIAYCINVILF